MTTPDLLSTGQHLLSTWQHLLSSVATRQALRDAIVSATGQREQLAAQLAKLGESLAEAEAERAALRQELASARAAAQAADRDGRAARERLREEAGMAAQQARHAEERMLLVEAQARTREAELREELVTPAGAEPTHGRGDFVLAGGRREEGRRGGARRASRLPLPDRRQALYRERLHEELSLRAAAAPAATDIGFPDLFPPGSGSAGAAGGPNLIHGVADRLGGLFGAVVQGAGNAAQSAGEERGSPTLHSAAMTAPRLRVGVSLARPAAVFIPALMMYPRC